jgi:hypothetical protein
MDESKARIGSALNFAITYGNIEGEHHTLWVLDQMVRALLGSDEDYQSFLQIIRGDPEDPYSEWRTGIAP